MTTAQLSARMKELGQPIQPTGVTKIEQQERRVDADDLVALAVALETTPNRLLLPADGGAVAVTSPSGRSGVISDGGTEVELTPAVRVPVWDAWLWATGESPLIYGPDRESPLAARVAEERLNAFIRENRPHDPVEAHYFDKAELRRHPELVRAAAALVRQARQEGVPVHLLHDFIELASMTVFNGNGDPAADIERGS
ncbi:MAG: hypothetical protein ACHP9Z_12440 [Streptosporangiales bacterium]